MGGIQPSVPGPDKDGILPPRPPQGADRPQASGRRPSISTPLVAEEAGRPSRRNLLEDMPRGFGAAESGALGEARRRETATRRAIDEARRRLAETGSGAGADPWAGWRRDLAQRRTAAAQPLPEADPAYPGRPQSPAPARQTTMGPKPSETQVALGPLAIQGIARFGPPAIAGLQYLWQKHLERQGQADAPAAPSKPRTPPPSRMQAHEPLPPSGGMEPPERPGTTRESFPAEERGPTLHVSPEPAAGKPAVEVFPDMSDELERWLVSESRGKKDGQQKDAQFLIDYVYKGLAKRGQNREHTHGGYHPDREEYLKERYIQGEDGRRKGSRRSDAAFKIGEGEEKEILDINVTDTRADRRTRTTREQIAFEAIKALKKRWGEKGDTITTYKSKGWIEEEWQDAVKRDIDAYLDAKYGPPREE